MLTEFEVETAIAAALRTVDRSMLTFADTYPADSTESGVYPVRTPRHGYPPGSHTGWTTGFWAGQLWLAYELTGLSKYRDAAEVQVRRFSERLRDRIDVEHHDIGFLYSLSCVAGWRLTGDEDARQTALAAADQLMTRYLPGARVLQAWGKLDDPEQRGRTHLRAAGAAVSTAPASPPQIPVRPFRRAPRRAMAKCP